MRKQTAKNHFLGQVGCSKLNCGQSIIKAYHDKFAVSADAVERFAAFAAGQAPQGECGAYYAARYLLSKAHHHKIAPLAADFMKLAGSLKCKEIRRQHKLTCLGCVEKAAELLERE